MSSQNDALRKRFETVTVETVREMIADRQIETPTLEFKELRSHFKRDDDRKHLARCLCAFANSDGGMVIWGVNARRVDDGTDCAQEEVLIDNVRACESAFHGLQTDIVSPAVPGAGVRALLVDGTEKGFLVAIVPQSDRPHMVTVKGDNSFYRRRGDSNQVITSASEVGDLFSRRQRPVLDVVTDVHGGGRSRTWRFFRVHIGIRNVGRGIAEAPYFAIRLKAPHEIHSLGLDGNKNFGLPRLISAPSDSFWRFGGDATRVLHPGTEQMVVAITGQFGDTGSAAGPVPPEPVVGTVLMAASGCPVKECELRVSGDLIVERVSVDVSPSD